MSYSGCWNRVGSADKGWIAKVFFASVMLILGCIPCQSQLSDCKAVVRSIYAKLMEAGKGRTLRMLYTVRTESKVRGKTITSFANVDLMSSSNRIAMISEQMELYQDASTTFIVIPQRKVIHINSSNLAALRAAREKATGAFRDSLFSQSDVVDCSAISGEVHSDHKATFRLRPGTSHSLHMDSFTIYFNEHGQTVQRVMIMPASSSSVSVIDYSFREIIYDFKTNLLDGSLVNRFFDARGKLLPKYSDYTLVDNRRAVR